jgi:hypothetical protein
LWPLGKVEEVCPNWMLSKAGLWRESFVSLLD